MHICVNPSCRAELSHDAQFCSKCGTARTQFAQCPECGRALEESGRFCPKCGHNLGVQLLTSNDIVRWQTFFESVGWNHHKDKFDDRYQIRINRSLPIPGADPSEPWIFSVSSLSTRQVLKGPKTMPLGGIEPADGAKTGFFAKSAALEVSKVYGLRWIIGTNRRLFAVKIYRTPYIVFESMINLEDIVAVRYSESLLTAPLGSAWSVEVLTSESPKRGLRLAWDSKPTPSGMSIARALYASYFSAVLGGIVLAAHKGNSEFEQIVAERFDRRVDGVIDKFSAKRDEGEQIMSMTVAYFSQFAPT